MRNFSLRPLEPERAFLAFPLVRNVLPDMRVQDWLAFAEQKLSRNGHVAEGGILVVENESGVIIGLVSFQVQADLEHGRVLTADHLIAFELLDRRRIVELLAEGLEEIATQLDCRAIHTSLPMVEGQQRPAWLVALLQARGHHVENMSFCKRMASGKATS